MTTSKDAAATEPDDASAGIARTLQEWAAAIEEGNVEKLASLVTEGAEFWTHGADPVVGRRQVVEAFQPVFDRYRMEQRFEQREQRIADDWAFLRGVEINVMVPRGGGQRREIRQRAMSVLQRGSDGRWRFARGMTNQGPRSD